MKAPSPDSYKQQVVADMSEHYSTMVETGTYRGDMVWAQKGNFSNIYSVELGEELYKRAVMRFIDTKHIRIFSGYSTDMLKTIVPTLGPALFWLDAHWSGGNTAKGVTPCPLLEELDVILATGVNHYLLIDDARCFGTLNGFPTLDEIGSKIGTFKIENDIIRKDLR
ncbi:hypothetical protein LCGC14_1822160 [marine sediment metagenome]|uniref:Uncharacterized protein n=1 Tax=marine sediment metagenome TaxID=412755 RepID=A0A0F9GIJ6_9ZZZZ